MKKTKIYYMILCLCCLSCLSGKAQSITFNHLTDKDGLSHYSVTSIYQDERGLMWFGTLNGVSLYNGKSFKIYRHEKNNPNSIVNNRIEQIIGDQRGTIYFKTQGGISAYDIKKEEFKTIFHKSASGMFFYDDFYMAYGNEIFRFNGEKFEQFYKIPDEQVKISRIHIGKDSIYIGTNQHGLYLLANQKLSHPISSGYVTDIFKDSSGNCWITNSRDGIGLYLIQNGKVSNFQCIEEDPSTITSNFTHRCCEDQQGNIWIGTFNGLTEYDKQERKFIRHYRKEHSKSLTHSSVWCLYCDNQGTIWAGTYFGGLNYFNPTKQTYYEYVTSPQEEDGLSSGIISQMTEDKNSNLWICTEGGGLNQYNRQTNTFRWYKQNNLRNSISHNNVKAIYYDPQHELLWLGTHLGGLNKLDLKTNYFTHYKHIEGDSTSIPSDIVMDIIPYKGDLLLSTQNGIGLFNPNTGKCQYLLHGKDQHITHATSRLLIDHQGLLWIVNIQGGIATYNFETKKLSIYKYNSSIEHSLSSNNINSIYEDSQNRLWFCTNDNGLDLYNRENDEFENFNMQHNGFSSDQMFNICEIDSNRLLTTTAKGISIFNLQTKKCTNYTNLPLVSLKENALYRTKHDEIFVGGIGGMISFDKKSTRFFSRPYSIFPSRLIVNGKEVSVGDKSGILSQSISDTKHITLRPSHDVFSIEYAQTDYIPFNEDSLIYCLEGFSNTWSPLNEQNTITYTNLNPGSYTLVVNAKDKNSKLVAENKLLIEVLPPFYQSTIAYLLYIISATALAYYLIRTYKHRIKLQESLKYEKKHVEDIEKMNQAKLHFFTNISHEFRTPLTLIIGQMEILLQMRSFVPTVYNRILGVYKNSLQMRELITELLDFQKQEQGYMTIKVSEHNIVDFIYEYYLLFQEYAKQRHIDFRFEKTHDNIQIWYDARQMQKVINNLISNAFKYTKEGGRISISIRKRNQEVIIEVTDTGIGISSKDVEKIFDRFYQTEQLGSLSSSSGSGIGLALTKGIVELHHGSIEVFSELDEGSTFSVHLKCGNTHFNPEQIIDKEEKTVDINANKQILEIQQPLFIEQEMQDSDNLLKGKRHKILIVEDNDSLRKMLSQIFDMFYIVITASNGVEGLEKVRTEQPDMVLSDIVMPEMSGIELCQAIKKDLEFCHIPVVLLTARTATEHTIEGLKTGADDYITKPFNIKILLSRCNNLINNRIMLQEKFSKQPQTAPQILATNDIDKAFVDKVMEIIEQHLDDEEFSVDILTGKMGIARTKLFTKMKAITGQTPLDFIMTIRLKHAAIMLKNNMELNISEISDRVGFNSPKYFTKCFKEKYNMVPQAYRKGNE